MQDMKETRSSIKKEKQQNMSQKNQEINIKINKI